MFRLFGLKRPIDNRLHYQDFLNCLHPNDLKRVDTAMHTAVVTQTSEYNDEYSIILPNKSIRDISVRCIIDRDNKGKAISMTGVCLDITEQQQKHALEIKSEMISMVSHELRTPIHTIKESISVVLEELTGNINAEQRDVLETAKQCIDRLTRLINNVLDFQKIEAGIVDLEFEKQNLNDLVREVSEIEEIAAKKKGLGFEVHLAKDPLTVSADSDKIIQVLTNLIHNAVKFTEKGTIIIKSARQGGFATVSVEDTGIGFTQEEAGKIFTKFGQTESARKLFPQGTGLGLAISKKIMDQHHGKIWAESKKPYGSAFYIQLPLKQKDE